MSTLKTNNIEHLDATSPSIEVSAAGGIQVGGALTATTGTFSGNVSIAGVLSYEDVTNIDSVGIITAQAGIHVTGGNVGVGTASPSDRLEVRGDTATDSAGVIIISSGDEALVGGDVIGQINFKDYDANAHAGGDQDNFVTIKAIAKHEVSDGGSFDGSDGEGYDLTFNTSIRIGSNSPFSEREGIRLTKDLNVGFGNTVPTSKLELNSSGSYGHKGTVSGRPMDRKTFIRKFSSNTTSTVAVIDGLQANGFSGSQLSGFFIKFTYRSMLGFNGAGGGHGERMISGRYNRTADEWLFDSETTALVGDAQEPTLSCSDNSDGTCNVSVTTPASTHAFGEFLLVAWDCGIDSPTT